MDCECRSELLDSINVRYYLTGSLLHGLCYRYYGLKVATEGFCIEVLIIC